MEKTAVSKTFASPGNRYKVVVVWLGYDKEGSLFHEVRVVNDKEKVLVSWRGTHRSTDVVWTQDCSMVAINDRQTRGGDYVYVVALHDSSAKLVRKPDQFFDVETLFRKHLFSGKFSDLHDYTMNAVRFLRGGLLEVDIYVLNGTAVQGKTIFTAEQAILLFDVVTKTWRLVYKEKVKEA